MFQVHLIPPEQIPWHERYKLTFMRGGASSCNLDSRNQYAFENLGPAAEAALHQPCYQFGAETRLLPETLKLM